MKLPLTLALSALMIAPSTGAWSSGTPQHLYVSDPDSHSILRFAMHNGIPNQQPDAEIGGLKLPRGIAIGPDNRLYVIDALAKQLLIYEPSPKTGSRPSHVLYLHGFEIDTVAVDSAGFVYIGYLRPCQYLPCAVADVYAPLPSGTQKPVARYALGGAAASSPVSALPVNATHHLAAVSAQQPIVFEDAPKRTQQGGYALFCPVATFAAAWGSGNTLYETDVGQGGHPPRPAQVYVIPDYLKGRFSSCPSYYTIKSATVPLSSPFGITQQSGLLYVTSAYNATVGSGTVFVFDSTKRGPQTPVAILGGLASELRSPWGVAIGP